MIAVSKAITTNPKDLMGAKKVPMGAVPPVAIAHEALAFYDGELKYGFRNWRAKKVSARIYVDACKRHLDEWLEGEETADDSGVHHLGHARACLGIILDAQETGNLIDDRVRGNFSKVINRLSDWVVKRKAKQLELDKKEVNEELNKVPRDDIGQFQPWAGYSQTCQTSNAAALGEAVCVNATDISDFGF